jgi:hypothetical protein
MGRVRFNNTFMSGLAQDNTVNSSAGQTDVTGQSAMYCEAHTEALDERAVELGRKRAHIESMLLEALESGRRARKISRDLKRAAAQAIEGATQARCRAAAIPSPSPASTCRRPL